MSEGDLVGALVGGKFRVERALGEGGMGSVYLAVQEPLGRQVALKVIRGADADDEQRARFVREATAVAQLKCPHIVTLYDFGEHDGSPYIAMELLEGETLRARMGRGRVGVDEALGWVRDLACALRSAHEAGIVHRDLKPENVVLVRDRDRGVAAKLLDFGIAKLRARAHAPGATAGGFVIGTPGYIAPEHVAEGRGDQPSVDVYALGVVLYELLAGEPPYRAPTPVALMMAHAQAPVPELSAGAASPAVAALVRSMLDKDPAHRPADGAALVAALDAARAARGEQPPFLPTEPAPLSLPSRPSIAVQPFIALGGDDDALFAEGIGEDILTALSCFKQLFVVSANSMLHREGRGTDPARVGRLLGVRHVLQGSVRRASGRVRINAKLVDTASGAQVWAQRYDRDLDDLFAVQDEVTRAIVACVAGRIEEAQAEIARRKAPHALAAYDWLARGRALHHRRTPEASAAARAALDKAVEIDPEYAQGHAWRACAYGQTLYLGIGGAKELQEAIRSTARALELDDQDAECHRLAAEVQMPVDLDRAWAHHERAIALNPNDARIVGQRGELSLYRGDLEVAAEALEQAVRLDPLVPAPFLRHLAAVRYLQRALDAAMAVLRRLGDERTDVVALFAAVAALRGDDECLRRARDKLARMGVPLQAPTKPFATPALEELWREGFERAAAK